MKVKSHSFINSLFFSPVIHNYLTLLCFLPTSDGVESISVSVMFWGVCVCFLGYYLLSSEHPSWCSVDFHRNLFPSIHLRPKICSEMNISQFFPWVFILKIGSYLVDSTLYYVLPTTFCYSDWWDAAYAVLRWFRVHIKLSFLWYVFCVIRIKLLESGRHFFLSTQSQMPVGRLG